MVLELRVRVLVTVVAEIVFPEFLGLCEARNRRLTPEVLISSRPDWDIRFVRPVLHLAERNRSSLWMSVDRHRIVTVKTENQAPGIVCRPGHE